MTRAPGHETALPWLLATLLLIPGCRLSPREQVEECHRLSQTLRSENAQLKDQMLALKSRNRDLSERAVDDARRLAQLEEANQQLETSVQAYQDERARLESAYQQLRATLPASPQPLSLRRHDRDHPEEDADPQHDPDLHQTRRPSASEPPRPSSRSGKKERGESWTPARPEDTPISSPSPGGP
jgi:hypothetical protein